MVDIVKEISIDGIFFPPILGYCFFTTIIWSCLKYALNKIGFYGLVWHAPLFNTSLFIIILSITVLTTL